VEAEVRRLTGDDEAFLLDRASDAGVPGWCTAVLTRAVDRIGEAGPVDAHDVRSLTVGDRQALLLALRRLMFGDRMDAVLSCVACGERMDLELAVDDLLVPAGGPGRPPHEVILEDGGAEYRVTFRLPTGGDREEMARAGARSSTEAAKALLRRCVEAVVPVEGGAAAGDSASEGLPPEAWPDGVGDEVGAAAEELDPRGELRLEVTCPSCGEEFVSLFDAGGYLRSELDGRLRRLYAEVHALAYHYRWGEREIMALASTRRRRYVEALSDGLAGR
jgi:hypothetical protein